jgi:hypothetical protein
VVMQAAVHQDPPRDRSEDRAWAIEAPWGLLVGVADGAGGMTGGAAAADLVERAAREALRTADPEDPSAWERLLLDVDRRIVAAGAGQTTAVLVAVTPTRWCGASVGDSVAWGLAPDGPIADLTDRQRRKPLLGSGEAVPVGFSAAARGRLLVATDGLAKYAPMGRIAAAAVSAPLERVGAELVDLVRLPRGTLQDDVAVVVVGATG